MPFRFDFAWLKYPIRKWNWIELKCFFSVVLSLAIGNMNRLQCSLSLLTFVTHSHTHIGNPVENKQITFAACVAVYCLWVSEWVNEWQMETKNYIFHEFVSVELLSIIIRLNYVWKVFFRGVGHFSSTPPSLQDCYFRVCYYSHCSRMECVWVPCIFFCHFLLLIRHFTRSSSITKQTVDYH